MRIVSPGFGMMRSLNRRDHVVTAAAGDDLRLRSIGSTTTTSTATPSPATIRCSGRTPSTTGWPSLATGAAATGSASRSDLKIAVAPSPYRALQEIHRRRADEAGDEQVVRTVVQIERRADLLDDAVVHDDDLVGHGHRLDLVVGDIDGRGLQALVQFLDLGAHGHAQLGVEVGQRLVEQEDLRVAHDGAAHGDALALAARELARVAVEQGVRPRMSAARLTRGSISALRRSRSCSEKAMLSATVMCG